MWKIQRLVRYGNEIKWKDVYRKDPEEAKEIYKICMREVAKAGTGAIQIVNEKDTVISQYGIVKSV